MKLLVIVLCLLSERFLVHVSAHHRFSWFNNYWKMLGDKVGQRKFSSAPPWVLLGLMIFPVLLVAWLVFSLFSNWFFGFVGLILNVVVFYYCIGPGNPFYPVRSEHHEEKPPEVVGGYLAEVNGQLFAVIFWYIALGPLGILAYRMISLSQAQERVRGEATLLTAVLDWMPAKVTSLFYLLVGNFQAGFQHFSRLLLASPEHNEAMLSACGLSALGPDEPEQYLMPQAEVLVEHAVIVLLVMLAIFTMASWL